MAAELMEGTELAREIVTRSAARATDLEASTGIRPCLATVIVGNDPASVTYVRMKENRCSQAGQHQRAKEPRPIGVPAQQVVQLGQVDQKHGGIDDG